MKKKKIYKALGLMSGTSMDGVDASIVASIDGERDFTIIENQYFNYDKDLYQKLTNLRDKIYCSKDLNMYSVELKAIEKEITLFHAKITNTMIKKNTDWEPDIIGFHGQTIFHDFNEKLSVQLGDGNLLSQLTKKTVVYDFRQNDLNNGGQGAPLTPIFHQTIKSSLEDNWWPVIFLNIGGISNVTSTSKLPTILSLNKYSKNNSENKVFAGDIAPGNCLIDEWIRKNSKHRYDKDGLIAKSGEVNKLILNQALDNYSGDTQISIPSPSLDVKDFDISFVRGLSLEDGAATLTHLTAALISEGMTQFMSKNYPNEENILTKATILICGGGRKNKHLIEILKKNLHVGSIELIDEYGFDGDFIESQAFGYLAIRSYLGLPITFPNTTGCKEPTTGGVIVKNY
jgi:anhydro-N-acetylmuramic acid kinase